MSASVPGTAITFAARLPAGRWRVAVSAVLTLGLQTVWGANFTVNSTADALDALAGDGLCATASGTCTLRAAIEETNALPGADTINLPAGIYLITLGNGDDKTQQGDLDIVDTLTIAGAGQFSTIVDGNFNDRVFDVHQTGALQMSAVTVRNGNVNGDGGGIRGRGPLTLTDVTLADNTGKDGGGVSLDKVGSTAVFANVTFERNSADKGAGLHADETPVTITGSVFSQNVADKEGGGTFLDKSMASVSTSVFDDNEAEKGGGLFMKDGIASTIADSAFTANRASKDGGGLYFDKSRIDIDRSLIAANTAEEGGGVFIKGGGSNIGLENTTISGNTATKAGGGIQKENNGPARLLNVTLYDNGSPDGGGVHVKGGNLSLTNTMIANSSQGADCAGTILSLGNNLDSDGSCQLLQPGDLPNTDPLVGPLQNNGGPTLTHALADLSPARDAGTNTGCPGTDQRGEPRPVDGDGDAVAVCDIGAYEAEVLYPDYDLHKTVVTFSDPYSGANPKAIPGAVMLYTIALGNSGLGAADLDSLVITEAVPAGTALIVTDFDAGNPGPVAFVDGAPASGLSYTFLGLGSAGDDVGFSNDGGASYGYTPTPGADGADIGVTHVRIAPKGTARFTGADPVATFLLKVAVQ